MNYDFEYDYDTFANDLYEYALYEKVRSENPHLVPSEVCMMVIGILDLGMTA